MPSTEVLEVTLLFNKRGRDHSIIHENHDQQNRESEFLRDLEEVVMERQTMCCLPESVHSV